MAQQPTLPQFDFNADGVKPKKDKRRRVQFRFWLDDTKPAESGLGMALDSLLERRQFAKFIRDAIRLMLALMAGDLSVLVELFPNVVEQIKAEGRAEAVQSEATAQFMAFITQAAEAAASKTAAAIESKRESVMAEAERLPAPGMSGGLKPLGGVGLKPLAAAPLPPPRYDEDDDILLEVSKADGGDSDANANFLKSMLALQGKKST
jgi:hypothetical protein